MAFNKIPIIGYFKGLKFDTPFEEFFDSKKFRDLFNLPKGKRIDVQIFDRRSKRLIMTLDPKVDTVQDIHSALTDNDAIVHIYDPVKLTTSKIVNTHFRTLNRIVANVNKTRNKRYNTNGRDKNKRW